MPDGTLAVVRDRDFHIDWVAPDSSVTLLAQNPT